MKQSLLDNSQTIITKVNNQLRSSTDYSNYAIEGLYQVPHGKGFKKDQIMFTVNNKGNWSINVIINIDAMKIKRNQPIGKYSNYDTVQMGIDSTRIFYQFVKNEFMAAIETNHIDELKQKDFQSFSILKDKINNDPSFIEAFKDKTVDEIRLLSDNTFKYEKTLVNEAVNIIINKLNPSYKVGNRCFNSYDEALLYCNECDFDPETMIQVA